MSFRAGSRRVNSGIQCGLQQRVVDSNWYDAVLAIKGQAKALDVGPRCRRGIIYRRLHPHRIVRRHKTFR